MFIEILFKMLLFKGGILIYTEHCIYIYIYIYTVYIYFVEKDIQLYIIYDIQELLGILLD